MANIQRAMDRFMKGTGVMINLMERANRLLRMVPFTMGTLRKGPRMGMEFTSGWTSRYIKGNGEIISLMGLGSMPGVMVENMLVNGKIIWCMAKENRHIKMDVFIMDNIMKIRNMVKVYTLGPTVRSMMVAGLMVNKRGKLNSRVRPVRKDTACGITGREFNGWMAAMGRLTPWRRFQMSKIKAKR
jgi:hypothetical protein